MPELFTAGDMAAASTALSSEAGGETPPSESTTPVEESTPAATTAPPTAPVESTPPPRGPIPYDRHEAVLTKTRREYDAKLEKLKWAEGVDPQRLTSMAQWYDRYGRDPLGFTQQVSQELLRHPEYGPKYRATLRDLIKEQQEPTEPAPDLEFEDGRKTYSQARLAQWQAWREAKLQAQFDARISPLEELAQSVRTAGEVQQRQQGAQQFATTTLTQLRKLPYFTEHEAAIKAQFAAQGDQSDEQAGAGIRDAYIHVLTTQVLPTLSTRERAAVVADLRAKPGASSLSPSANSASTPARYKDFREGFEAEFAKRRG